MNNNFQIPDSALKRVVVIGGGFAGITFVKKLPGNEFQVVLFDKHNYHTFQPLLYQVATGGLEPDSIAHPLRNIFHGRKNFFFRLAEIQEINTDKNVIMAKQGTLPYDMLVLATGSETNFYGMNDIEKIAMPLKNIPDALNLRSYLLQNFEQAVMEKKTADEHLNIIIVGGGPTGVELAGALAEFKRHVVPNDYPEINPENIQIWMIEASDRILGSFSKNASQDAFQSLSKMGVQIKLKTFLNKYYDNMAYFSDQSEIRSSCIIWSAGVKGNYPLGIPDASIHKSGRLYVDEFNRLKGFQNIFVIGDAAIMQSDARFLQGHPMVAQPAIQQAKCLAGNLANVMNNKPMIPFRYSDLGSMATIGRNKAVAEFGFAKFSGAFAWIIWLTVHLMALVGFRNRIIVLINWIWNYFSYDRAIRLIIRPFKRA